ncbi:hypothetical protein DY000_02014678 [Brassica cretica]|uniref:Uncharacterized protein n=1 Tax=Brassica cretica TaxID=69181 RepID=A0ABQ7CM69_BRACR|nr:hypothetical protein DY000_02014678 [Brassica cretica]
MAIDAYQKLPCFSPFFVTRSENKDDDGHDSILAQAETKSTQALEIRTDLAQASSMSLASKLPRQACHNWHKLFSPDKKRSRCVPSMDKASLAVAVPFRQSSQDVTVVVLWRGKQRRAQAPYHLAVYSALTTTSAVSFFLFLIAHTNSLRDQGIIKFWPFFRFVTREEDLIQETLRHFDWSLLFCCDTPRTLDQIMEPDIVGNCC